jgi:hypothetical protein
MRYETGWLTLFTCVAIYDTVFAVGRRSLSRHGVDSPSIKSRCRLSRMKASWFWGMVSENAEGDLLMGESSG